MFLQKLSLINFKNYRETELIFSEKVNCFVGNNGAGKTNLLDAIYYLSFCKSYFNSVDSQNILHSENFFTIQGLYKKDNTSSNSIHCVQKRNQRKQFKINKKDYERFADHIGHFPLVIITPLDNNLINNGSEERRKYFDGVISQFDKIYLDNLLNYNKAVSQRNSLLKNFAENHYFDKDSLEIWDEQLINLGSRIFEKRKQFLKDFASIFQEYYDFITLKKESVSVVYESHLETKRFDLLLKESIERDRMLKYTSTGIHKDDFIFKINDFPLKKFGSQGQQKSYLVALKLAQFDYIKKVKKIKPILLLDDIFDKLDILRIQQIMKLVSDNNFGQIFITDTSKERIIQIFKDIETKFEIFEIFDGMVEDSND